MNIQLINEELLEDLRSKAQQSERKRMNFDLRTTPEDMSQRMLNCLEPGTQVPIHRHEDTTETIVCLKGQMDVIFFEELPNMDAGGPIHDGKTAVAASELTASTSCVPMVASDQRSSAVTTRLNSNEFDQCSLLRQFKEIHRVSISPASGNYGIQIPLMAWHTVEVKAPSVIFEAKDGPYKG